MHHLRLFILFILLVPAILAAQKFHVNTYTIAKGIPSNQIQDVVQDTFGFLWLATDAGLTRFDGNKFESYSKDLPSQYGRCLLKTKKGIYYSHDAGISFFRPTLDSVSFELLEESSIAREDKNLYYPNQLFQQKDGTIWISQPNGQIVRLQNGKLEYYDLGKESTTGKSESRFIFAESDKGQLWTVAQSGILYQFNKSGNNFLEQGRYGVINDMTLRNEDLWLGGAQLHRIKLDREENGILSTEKFHFIKDTITAIAFDHAGNIFLGIQRRGLFYLDQGNGNPARLKEIFSNNDPHRVDELPFKNINRLYCQDQVIWVCSDEGFGILQKRFFESADALTNGNTIGMAEAFDGSIFINFGDIFKIEATKFGYEARQLPSLRRGAISFVSTSKDKLWAGTTNGELLQLTQEGQLLKSTDLRWRGESIFSMVHDQNKQTWFCQAPIEKPVIGVACVLENGTIKYYDEQHGFDNRILVIKEGPAGRIYAAGIGHSSYLYRYLPEEDTFLNLSVTADFQLSPNFEVHDIAIDHNGLVWLATTDGLLVFDTDRVRRIDLGIKYTGVEIRAVANMSDGSIWASTDTEGLLYINDEVILAIGEESGLPSKIMAYRSLLIDKNNRLWTGTVEGVVYSYLQNPKPFPTPPPLLISGSIEGEKKALKSFQLSTKQSMDIHYNTPAFHGYRLFYEYQLDQGHWIDLGTRNSLHLENLESGDHELRIRAKKEGGFSWSRPLVIPFKVMKPWYQRPFWSIFIAAVIFIGILTIFRLTRKRYREKIDSLIKELKSTKAEASLQEANLEQIQKKQQSEETDLRITSLTLELLRRLILKINPGMKWDNVLEHLSIDLMRIPGVIAFEIARKQGNKIEFEGYSELTMSFTSATAANNPSTCLAAYCLERNKSIILDDVSQASRELLGDRDKRIEVYKSVVGVTFYLQQSQKAILFLYADKTDFFDEYNLRTLGVLAAYLEQIA